MFTAVTSIQKEKDKQLLPEWLAQGHEVKDNSPLLRCARSAFQTK